MKDILLELDPDEEVLGLIRAHVSSQALPFLLAFVWALGPFFFLFPLLGLGIFGLVFFILLLISGLWYAVKRWRIWQRSMLLVTDMRVIDVDQTGFFSSERAEVTYDKIKDVSVLKQNIVQRLFSIGTVRIRTSKALAYDLQMAGVKYPEDVVDLILEVQYMLEHRTEGESFHVAKKKIR